MTERKIQKDKRIKYENEDRSRLKNHVPRKRKS